MGGRGLIHSSCAAMPMCSLTPGDANAREVFTSPEAPQQRFAFSPAPELEIQGRCPLSSHGQCPPLDPETGRWSNGVGIGQWTCCLRGRSLFNNRSAHGEGNTQMVLQRFQYGRLAPLAGAHAQANGPHAVAGAEGGHRWRRCMGFPIKAHDAVQEEHRSPVGPSVIRGSGHRGVNAETFRTPPCRQGATCDSRRSTGPAAFRSFSLPAMWCIPQRLAAKQIEGMGYQGEETDGGFGQAEAWVARGFSRIPWRS